MLPGHWRSVATIVRKRSSGWRFSPSSQLRPTKRRAPPRTRMATRASVTAWRRARTITSSRPNRPASFATRSDISMSDTQRGAGTSANRRPRETDARLRVRSLNSDHDCTLPAAGSTAPAGSPSVPRSPRAPAGAAVARTLCRRRHPVGEEIFGRYLRRVSGQDAIRPDALELSQTLGVALVEDEEERTPRLLLRKRVAGADVVVLRPDVVAKDDPDVADVEPV